MNTMKILSPAKINLFLQITGKRPDGYHDLFTLMCRVSLCDTVSLTVGTDATRISCTDPHVPEDESNLAHRAASLFFKNLGCHEHVQISIDKQIPVGAGLGGGSSNAASVLMGLNAYYKQPFSHEELMGMGLSMGADIPFFIFQKPAIATGVGEKLEPYEKLAPFKILLVYPGFAVSTANVYKKFNFGLTKCKKNFKSSFFKERVFDAKNDLCNDLETVTTSEYPDVTEVKASLLHHGAQGALMSGSGSSVFGLFPDSVSAEPARQNLSQNPSWKVYLVDMML